MSRRKYEPSYIVHAVFSFSKSALPPTGVSFPSATASIRGTLSTMGLAPSRKPRQQNAHLPRELRKKASISFPQVMANAIPQPNRMTTKSILA